MAPHRCRVVHVGRRRQDAKAVIAPGKSDELMLASDSADQLGDLFKLLAWNQALIEAARIFLGSMDLSDFL